MSDRVLMAKFEDIPNEILIECFEYFQTTDLFYSFGQLNHRFNELIRTLPLHLNFQDIDKSVYDILCAQMLVNPDNRTGVYSLRLSNKNTPGQIKDFLSKFALDQFSHLRSLTLIDVKENNIQALQEILPLLSQITTLNLLDSRIELNKLESILPMDNLQTLSLNSNIAFVQRTIPIKSLTLSTISLNDICRLFQYTPLLEYLTISRVPKAVFNLEYRRRSRPVHLKHLNFIEFNSNFRAIAHFVQTMSNLRNFTISSWNDDRMHQAIRWQELITSSLPSLTNFQFRFEINYHVDTNIFLKRFEKFRTDFWLNKHQWYTECVNSIAERVTVIYTIPYLAQWKQLPLQSTRYCDNPLMDNSQTFKNVTELVVSLNDIFEHGQYYFPNITSLVIIDSLTMIYRKAEQDLVGPLKSLINLLKLRHLDIPMDCLSPHPSAVFKLLQLAPQLSSLSPAGCFYKSLTAHPDLSRYLTEKIRKLDISRLNFCLKHRSAMIDFVWKIIPNLEQLTAYPTNINDFNFLLNHFSKVRNFTVYCRLPNYSQELEVFKKQLTEQNGLFHETASNFGTESFIHFSTWIGKNEQGFSN